LVGFGFNHTAFKLNSLWHIGYVLDNLYDFNMCSRVDLKLYNPARRPAFIKAPRLSGSIVTGGRLDVGVDADRNRYGSLWLTYRQVI